MKRDDEPPAFLDIADKALAKKRLASRPSVLKAVMDVFEHPDPNAHFPEWARRYIGKEGKEARTADINNLQWVFGIADRLALKKLLRLKSIVGSQD